MGDETEKVDKSKYECTQAKTKGGRVTKICFDKANRTMLGSGAFANVYMAKYKQKGGKTGYVALKESTSEDLPLREEIDLMRKLDHPNIIGIKFFFKNKGAWYVGLEFMEGGDLFQFIRENYDKRSGLGSFCEIFGYQIFRGLAYLHAKNIVHRDLKPENALISEETGRLKLTDFGCSKVLEEGIRDTYRVGTKEFRAPELLLHTLLSTPPIDAWSAGVIMTEMGCGRPVFGEGPADDWEQYLRVVEFLGQPTRRDERQMGSRPKRKVSLHHFQSNCCRSGEERASTERRTKRDLSGHLSSSASVHDADAFVDLVRRLLVYAPADRMVCWDSCAHRFFKRITDPGSRLTLPNGNPLPGLTDFSQEEVASMTRRAKRVLLGGE